MVLISDVSEAKTGIAAQSNYSEQDLRVIRGQFFWSG